MPIESRNCWRRGRLFLSTAFVLGVIFGSHARSAAQEADPSGGALGGALLASKEPSSGAEGVLLRELEAPASAAELPDAPSGREPEAGSVGLPSERAPSRGTGRGRRGRPAAVRGRSTRAPWVDVHRLRPPFPSREPIPPSSGVELPPWGLFQTSSRARDVPVGFDVPFRPIFSCPPPLESDFARAARHLARRKLFSEVRKFMKRAWREEFRNTPTMGYAEYLQRIGEVNQLGRDEGRRDWYNADWFANRFREDLFGREPREGEKDFEMFAWGPLVVMDSGALRLDVGRAVHGDLDPEPELRGTDSPAPILSTLDYEVHTAIRLGFDPIEPIRESDPTWLIDRYGVEVEVAWLSDVLGREMFRTELEVEVERNGEFAAMVSFVFRSRD